MNYSALTVSLPNRHRHSFPESILLMDQEIQVVDRPATEEFLVLRTFRVNWQNQGLAWSDISFGFFFLRTQGKVYAHSTPRNRTHTKGVYLANTNVTFTYNNRNITIAFQLRVRPRASVPEQRLQVTAHEIYYS